MKALNSATEVILRRFKEKCDNDIAEGKKTLYSAVIEKKKELHPECAPGEWPEEAREQAIEALGMWAAVHVGDMLAAVMNELNDLGRTALATGDVEAKKAAVEVAGSMGFIETVFRTWFDSVDIEAVAEGLFDAGVEHEKNPVTPKKKSATSLIDELMAKYRPSNN